MGKVSSNQEVGESLLWQKVPVLNDGYVCLVDWMGADEDICSAARISFGNDARYYDQLSQAKKQEILKILNIDPAVLDPASDSWGTSQEMAVKNAVMMKYHDLRMKDDENLIRYMMRHNHGTPSEMCEVKFLIRIPMDAWRQFVRHRVLSINEYSTRYSPAIDSQQITEITDWRLQSKNNKQGSSGFLEDWPQDFKDSPEWEGAVENYKNPGHYLSEKEQDLHKHSKDVYGVRLLLGVAKEQARKDLPLSTYTEAYVKCDLRNWFHFLGLRLDSHAQLEIRLYAEAIAGVIKKLYPLSYSAFEDYVLNGFKLTALDIEFIGSLTAEPKNYKWRGSQRELQELKDKLQKLNISYDHVNFT